MLVLPGLLFLSFCINSLTKDKIPLISEILIITSGIMSILWIYVLASILMDFMMLFKNATGFNDLVLSIVILSIGNSLNDLYVDTELAKRGFSITAVTGIFSGQFYNMAVGFSLNCILSFYRRKKNLRDTEFKLFDSGFFGDKIQILCLFVMGFSAVRFIYYIVVGYKKSFVLDSSDAGIAFYSYIFFLVVFVLLAFAL